MKQDLKDNLRKLNRRYAKVIVVTLRILLGATFIFSGFVKGIDLWGFIFKMEEYLSVMDIVLPRSVSLTLCMTVATVEFLCGLLLLLGSYRRVVPVIMGLMMAVMLPLSGWLFFASPIEDCGCFGDAVALSNGATFFKNILITAGVAYLVKYNKYVRWKVYHDELQWLVWMGGLVYMTFLSLTCYNVQPMIDFRPFPEGSKILSETTDDDAEVTFVYTNGSVTQEFTADNLPQDSSWTFVERKDGTGKANTAELAIFDGDEEVAEDVIANEGQQMLFVVPEMNRVDLSYTYFVNELYRLCNENGIDFIALLAADHEGIEWWKDYSMANYECFSAEDTQLKSLVRGKMSLVYLEDGIIKWKRTISSLVERGDWQEGKYGADFPNHMVTDLSTRFWRLTGWFLGWLVFVGLIEAVLRFILSKKEINKKS